MCNIPSEIYPSSVVRDIDNYAIYNMEISTYDLMLEAGKTIHRFIHEYFPSIKKIVLFCGVGNNGGDGFVLARLLMESGLNVIVVKIEPINGYPEAAEKALSLYLRSGGHVLTFEGDVDFLAKLNADLYIDAILGLGVSRSVTGLYLEAINYLNSLDSPILSIDIPSGLNSDTGMPMKTAVRADITLVLVALKQGLFLGSAADYVGKIFFESLNITKKVYDNFKPSLKMMDASILPAILPKRLASSHKGSHGTLLIVGGDENMGGAVSLAAESALRSGIGMVKIATHPKNRDFILRKIPEVLCYGIVKRKQLEPLLGGINAIVLGPGLGKSIWSKELYDIAINSNIPLVVDADALSFLSKAKQKRNNWILTPHPGEAGMLLDTNSESIQSDRVNSISRISKNYGGVVVLKGHNTLVMKDKDKFPKVCRYGNPGMATAGMGDLLAGMIGSFLAQKISLTDASLAGVMIHALAGDSASKEGEKGMIPSDLIPYIRKLVD